MKICCCLLFIISIFNVYATDDTIVVRGRYIIHDFYHKPTDFHIYDSNDNLSFGLKEITDDREYVYLFTEVGIDSSFHYSIDKMGLVLGNMRGITAYSYHYLKLVPYKLYDIKIKFHKIEKEDFDYKAIKEKVKSEKEHNYGMPVTNRIPTVQLYDRFLKVSEEVYREIIEVIPVTDE